jgi:hypothetical protein
MSPSPLIAVERFIAASSRKAQKTRAGPHR